MPSRDFRRSGKLAIAWAETFGEFVRGNLPYYLATSFDKIWLQPSGTLGLTGLAIEQVFLHDALAKVGVDFQSAKRHEYKSAADQFTETGFTGPAREAAERLLESVAEQLADGIAVARGTTVEQARAAASRAARSSPSRPSTRGWSTSWATATRSTTPRGRRPGPTRPCSTCSATSGCTPSLASSAAFRPDRAASGTSR